MDLDTGAGVAAEVMPPQGDTATMPDILANAIEHLTALTRHRRRSPTRDIIRAMRWRRFDGGPWRTGSISEPHRDGYSLWRGDDAARRAVYDRGGMRRVWLRGRDNVQKRYLIHVAGYNLGLLMRLLTGTGTPRELIAMASARILAVLQPDGVLIVMIFVVADNQHAAFAVMIRPIPLG